ncbi:MAG: glycosyltransferase family 4 protein [Clostridiaceae bacterium]|jgi:L-malate glycosyltransferase|nr:glycosyltransferase family 4 protein [Clostridiaceae bacterium]
MKIILVTDLYPVMNNEKTTPRTLYDFVQGWKALGHEVSVIKPNFILNSFIRKKPFYKQGQYNDVLNLNFWLPFLMVGKNFLDDTDSLVIAHMPSGILFADKLNVPFVAGIHQSDLDVLTKPIYKFYFGKRLLKALRNSKAIACRSYPLKNKLLNLYPEFSEKTFVAPSGIEENIITNISENLGDWQNRKIKVLTVANYKKRKNIDKVIEAVKDMESFDLTVIGNNVEKSILSTSADSNENIHLIDYLPHEKILEKMRNSDIFILPSENETFGMVYLEAMASGCITIGTKGTGIDGIVKNNENGFLINPTVTDIKNILNTIKNMDKNALKLLQENSFQTIQNYTKEKCCNEYLQQILRFCKDFGK